MKKLVVLTGAGISAESGLKTFRDGDGLWENHRIEDVATPEAFNLNPELVLDFYNWRREDAALAQPNEAHLSLARLEKYFDVHIITQNVDDLHERAGSSHVLHLHGQLAYARSSRNPKLRYNIGNKAIKLGDLAEDGSQLRPDIVWFGEPVPMIEPAAVICQSADIFMIIGTSLQVYPAAGLIDYAPANIPLYLVDKQIPKVSSYRFELHKFEMEATNAMPEIEKQLLLPTQN